MDRLLLSLRSFGQSSKDVLDLVLQNALENDDLSYIRENNVIEKQICKTRLKYNMSFYVNTHYKYFTHAPFLEDRRNNDLPKRKLEFRPRFSFKVSWFLSIADPLRCSSDLLPKPLTPITDVVINLPLFLLCGRDAKFGFSSDPDMHPIRR